MIIDDNVLVQAYATVLAGVLIFLTLKRKFSYQEAYEAMRDKLRLELFTIIEERDDLVDELNRHLSSSKKNLEAAPDRPGMKEDIEANAKRLDGLIKKKAKEQETKQSNLDSLTARYLERRNRYYALKQAERFLDIFMLSAMFVSFMVVVVGRNPYEQVISVPIFSVGIIVLIVRVYLYGEEVDKFESLMPER